MKDLLSTMSLSELNKARDRYVEEREDLRIAYHESNEDSSYISSIEKIDALIERYESVIAFY